VAQPGATDLCEECESRWARHASVKRKPPRVEIEFKPEEMPSWPTIEEIRRELELAKGLDCGSPDAA
jgi:hypothetical protein